MATQSAIEHETGIGHLTSSPIRPAWVLEGDPVARNKRVSVSADGTASSFIWDCTAGRFNWFYDEDETIYVIEGSVVVREIGGAARRMNAGDTALFHAGSRTEWHVEKYIRKFAIIRAPLPRSMLFARRCYRLLKRIVGARGRKQAAPAMCQNS